MSRISQRQADAIAQNRLRSQIDEAVKAQPWVCQSCGEARHEMSYSLLEERYGKEYADQTSLAPCSCLKEFFGL